MTTNSSSKMILHIWPGSWNLPSIDPSCIAAVLYLQYTIPGKFTIVESSNPDVAPTGQLPFLIHEEQIIPTFALIAKYVAGLKDVCVTNINSSLNNTENSQKVAWCAHVESNMGDLVYHTLYSHQDNWTGLMQSALASLLPVPQCYYVPGRIRESHRPRLEAAGLWNLLEVEKQKKSFRDTLKPPTKDKIEKHTIQKAFEREKVTEKARASMDIYVRLLGQKHFFFSDRPTTLDILLAAHVLLLLDPPFPDPFLKTLVNSTYPSLSEHARRVHAQTMGSLGHPARSALIPTFSWCSLVPWPSNTRKKQVKKSPEDVYYDRMRWSFYGLAIGSLAAYLVIMGDSVLNKISAKGLEESEATDDATDDDLEIELVAEARNSVQTDCH